MTSDSLLRQVLLDIAAAHRDGANNLHVTFSRDTYRQLMHELIRVDLVELCDWAPPLPHGVKLFLLGVPVRIAEEQVGDLYAFGSQRSA